MSDLSKFSDEVWDRFFDFIYDDIEELTKEQVDEALRVRGIDVTESLNKIKEAIRNAHESNEGVCER